MHELKERVSPSPLTKEETLLLDSDTRYLQ